MNQGERGNLDLLTAYSISRDHYKERPVTPLQIAMGGLALMVGLLALAQRLGSWENKPLARCLAITAAGCFVAWCFLLFPAWCGWASAAVVGAICLRFIATWVPKPTTSTQQSPADNERLSIRLRAYVPQIVFGLVVACYLVWCAWMLVDQWAERRRLDPHPEPMPSFSIQMVLPDGRAIINSTPEDLRAAFHNSTVDQFNRLLGGKWIKLSGKIQDNLGNGTVMLLAPSPPSIFLDFGKAWEDQLSTLPRGSSVTIRGKMGPARPSWIILVECELL
jgi:hypothetical protein